jgi:hypothetical protein
VLDTSASTCQELLTSYSPLVQTCAQPQAAESKKTASVAEPLPKRKQASQSAPHQQSAGNFTVTAKFLDQMLIPSILLSPFSKLLGRNVEAITIFQQIDKMIKDCGLEGDPLGETLVQQVVILRFVNVYMHSMTALSILTQDQAVSNAAACTVSGELRRTIRDLDAYCRRKQRSQKKKPKTAFAGPGANEAVDVAAPADVVIDRNAPSSGFPADLSERYPSTPAFTDDATDMLPNDEELFARSSRAITPLVK